METIPFMFLSVLFGGVGFGYFIYGKKQKKLIPFCVGIALFVLPYLFASVLLLIIAAVILMIIPYFIKI
ncbi:MAG: hypothetical protein HRU38_02720 [Saccharospirillaceae bacterium]|nr:hypothetical protein [Pseudomonadales bacterium]NRB77575.1 hypothetical protein [Saccharospirillaceae bacterium]